MARLTFSQPTDCIYNLHATVKTRMPKLTGKTWMGYNYTKSFHNRLLSLCVLHNVLKVMTMMQKNGFVRVLGNILSVYCIVIISNPQLGNCIWCIVSKVVELPISDKWNERNAETLTRIQFNNQN